MVICWSQLNNTILGGYVAWFVQVQFLYPCGVVFVDRVVLLLLKLLSKINKYDNLGLNFFLFKELYIIIGFVINHLFILQVDIIALHSHSKIIINNYKAAIKKFVGHKVYHGPSASNTSINQDRYLIK